MPRSATRPRAPRGHLSKERVFRAAVELADGGGLESLTMRKLAHELGVGAMSLYYYVPNKDELITGMVDIVFSEIELPPGDVDWRAAMRRRARSTREALNRHRWAVALRAPREDRSIRQRRGCSGTRARAGPSARRAGAGTAAPWARGRIPVHRRSRRRPRRQGRPRLRTRVRLRPRPHPRRTRGAARAGLSAAILTLVVRTGNWGRSLYGAQRSQLVATRRKCNGRGSRSNTGKPLPWVATGCLRRSMVRRGSTVRVRQGSAKGPEIGPFSFESTCSISTLR